MPGMPTGDEDADPDCGTAAAAAAAAAQRPSMFSPRLDWALSPLLDWPASARNSGSGGRLDSARLAEPGWLDSARLSGARRSGFFVGATAGGGGSCFIKDSGGGGGSGGGGLMEVRSGGRAPCGCGRALS